MIARILAGAAAAAMLAGCTSTVTVRVPVPVHAPVFPPARTFAATVTNPYYPLPAGRTLIYTGIKDGVSQVDTVHITGQHKLILGIRATVVTDTATHDNTLLEKTTDYFAQDAAGNVWYLGEETAAYGPGGKIDHAGSWTAGVNGARPGIVMLAHPRVTDAYRSEYLAGEAEDQAWITDTGGTWRLGGATHHGVITSLEWSRLEPGVVDRKLYVAGIGIVSEQAMSGPAEYAALHVITGP